MIDENSHNGEFTSRPEPPMHEEPAMIILGLNDDNWKNVYSNLQHELFELAMCFMNLRYIPSFSYSRDHGQYLFAFDHKNFSDLNERVAFAVLDIADDLKRKWKEFQNRNKKKSKK